MRKILFLILFTEIIISPARSQVLIALIFGDRLNTPDIEFGLNVGANYSTLTNYPDAKYASGLNLGLYFNFRLSDHFYLHPELQLKNRMGTKGIDRREIPSQEFSDVTLHTERSLDYMTLIFLPRYKLTNQLYFEAGIHGSLRVGADAYYRIEPDENSELVHRKSITGEIKALDTGIDVGLGYKFGKGEGVNLSVRFSQGFINTLKDESQPGEYNRGFHVLVGIPIGVGKEDVQQKISN